MNLSLAQSGINYFREFNFWNRNRSKRYNSDSSPGFVVDESGVVSAEMVLLLAATVSVALTVSNVVGNGSAALADTTSVVIETSGDNFLAGGQSSSAAQDADPDATPEGSGEKKKKKKKNKRGTS